MKKPDEVMKDEKFQFLEATVDFGYRGKKNGIWDVYRDNPDDYSMYYIVIDYYDEADHNGRMVTWEKVVFLSYPQTEPDPKGRQAHRIHPCIESRHSELRVSPYLRESCFFPLESS